MRIIAVILVLLVSLSGVAGADVIRIAATDDPIARVVAKVAKEVYRQIGHDVEISFFPALRSAQKVNDGSFDAELSRSAGFESRYPNLVRVKEPIFSVSASAIVREGSKIDKLTWQSMKNYRVGYPLGYRLMDIRLKGSNATTVSNTEFIPKMVQTGRLDVGILITSTAKKATSVNSGIRVLDPPLETVALYHYVHFKRRRLVPQIEDILIKMNDSGLTTKLLSTSN
jgi:polar amino acid transport system substrate-binding protein